MEYTKGEWKLKHHHGVLRVAVDGDKPEICDMIGGIIENAHLIAAAPDMYEALKGMGMLYAEYMALCPDPNTKAFELITEYMRNERKALAKAEGK